MFKEKNIESMLFKKRKYMQEALPQKKKAGMTVQEMIEIEKRSAKKQKNEKN